MKFKEFFFHGWGIAIIIVICALLLTGLSIWLVPLRIEPEQKEQTKPVISQNLGIRLDSLAKLNIHITLWTESKEDFQKLHGAKWLEKLNSRTETFLYDMTQSSGDFSWEAYKDWMYWQETTIGMFTNFRGETDRFVAVGYYVLDGQKLRFYGDIYKYIPHE